MKGMFIGFAVVSILLVVAFIPVAQLEPLQDKADFRLCWGPEPKSLDSAIVTGSIEMKYIQCLFEGLVTYDRHHPDRPVPGLAEKWDISPDRLTYTFHLRKNAHWSNGDPLTAHDFHYSWKRILNLEIDCLYIYMMYYIKNSEAFTRSRFAEVELKNWDSSTALAKKLKTVVRTLQKGARVTQLDELKKVLDQEQNQPVPADKKQAELREKVIQGLKLALKKAARRPKVTWEDVGIKVINDHKLEVKLENRTPFILDIFAFPTLFPVPEKVIKKYGESWIKPEYIVCSGPFILDRWIPYYMILLKKNPHYYAADQVKINNVACYTVDRPTTALNYYERGKLDFLYKTMIPTDFVESLMKRKDFKLYATFASTYLRYNCTKKPFNDVRIRRAFSLVIDRDQIMAILKGGEVPTSRLVPPIKDYPKYQPQGITDLNDDNKQQRWKEARRLIKEVYPDYTVENPGSFPEVEFLFSATGAKSRDIFTVMRKQFKDALGIEVKPKFLEWQVYLGALTKKNYDIGYGAWIGDYPDANTFIDMWITGSGNNRTGWGSPKFDQWIKDAAQEVDPIKRNKILARCEKMILEDEVVCCPLYFRTDYLMVKPNVRGVITPNVMDTHLLKYFWVEKD